MPRLCPPLPFHGPTEPNEFLLGRLILPTGQLVACDPVTRLEEARPFERRVAPGTYAVRLGALEGDAAYVAVLVGEGAVVHWEAARFSGADEDGFYVDASTAAFMDLAGVAALRRRPSPDPFTRLLDAGYRERPHAVVDLGGGGNLVAFGTGTDGRFSSYWGLDERGAPVVLVTDLGVLRASHTELRAAPEPPPPPPPSMGAKILPFPSRKKS